jgi:conjugative relaxase-like TrwC/TraI family protein
MLGVHGVGRDGADYYLSDPARELPEPVPGHWTGAAAAALGLERAPHPEEFRRLLRGHQPRTGQPMGSGRASLAAFDLTFSAPKSVSVLFALGGEEAARRVVEGHAAAVAGALGYLEEHGVTATRRSGPERSVVATTGMIAAEFTHGVNRNGDPHVHSHVVMANLVHAADGRWSACDGRGIAAHRPAASEVYAAHLRAALSSALGVSWAGTPGRPYEVVGVMPELLGEFSSRAADIHRRMHEVGAHSARAGRVAWAATRPAKRPSRSYAELAPEWARRARAVGGPMELGRATGHPPPTPCLVDEHRFAAAISLTPHGGARRRDVVAAFAAAAPLGVEAAPLARLVDHWVPDPSVGVAETLHHRRDVVPANHVLGALGPRPLNPTDHALWVGAAAAFNAYRDRWGLDRVTATLVAPGSTSGLSSLSAPRLADHLRTARHLEAVRARLGRRQPAEVDLGIGR